jgi:hypothetical protein
MKTLTATSRVFCDDRYLAAMVVLIPDSSAPDAATDASSSATRARSTELSACRNSVSE